MSVGRYIVPSLLYKYFNTGMGRIRKRMIGGDGGTPHTKQKNSVKRNEVLMMILWFIGE